MSTYGSTARGRRIADEDLVEKGALRQGVAPVLARVKPARGLRRTVHAPNQVVGKGLKEGSVASRIGHHLPGFDTTGLKRDEIKSVLLRGQNHHRDVALGAAGGAAAGAAGVAAMHSRKVAKAGIGGLKVLGNAVKQPKALMGGLKGGYAAGRAGPMASRLPTSSANVGTRVGQSIGHAVGSNPVKAGLLGGAAGMGALTAGNGQRDQVMAPVPPLAPLYGGFGKRSYDPEGERRFRQGAAGAATGVGAVGAGAYAARETRDATRVARRGAAFGPHAGNLRVIEIENGAGNKIKAKLVNQRAVHVADRLKRGGIATSRSGALAGAGALGLAGVSGTLFRSRNEPRWD